MKPIPKKRIYISSPLKLSAGQLTIKEELVAELVKRSFEPQEFLRFGSAAQQSWTFKNVANLMAGSQGALILGFARSKWEVKTGTYLMPSEYSHFEGALALNQNIPTMIVAEHGVINRGIVSTTGGEPIWYVDVSSILPVMTDAKFACAFESWVSEIEQRPRVFLGYCGLAQNTANAIRLFIEGELGIKVFSYAADFVGGESILDELERAARECTCGIFLFTKDDPLESSIPSEAAPRDNVVFEAGYFIRAKSKRRTLVVREEGAKMPADIGGNIYVSLKDREDISTIHLKLEKFLAANL